MLNLQAKWHTQRYHYSSKVKESEVAQSCQTLCDPMDCSLPGSSVHGIYQARILEWVAISFSRRSSWPRDWTQVSRTIGRHFTFWATREAHYSSKALSKDWGVGGSPIVEMILPLITQLMKTNHTILHGLSTFPLQWPTPYEVWFSLNPNKSTSYLSLCLSLNSFAMRHQELELH